MKNFLFFLTLMFSLCFVVVGARAQTQPLQPINARYLGIGVGGGTADAQTVTYTPATVAYTSFQVVSWKPTHSNATTTPTLNVDGIGPITIIKTNGSALIVGDISTTNVAQVMYDGTAFELLNPQNAYSGGTPINAPGLGTDANGNLIAITPSGTSPGPYIAPQAVSGCGVDWTGLLNFTVGACTYIVNGVTYTSPITNLTDSAADGTFPRIDVIFVDTSGVPQILDGMAAMNPATPVTDPSTQLVLEPGILVNANATTPGNITSTLIYDENVEWTTATGGTNSARVNVASTNNPYHGSLDVEFGNGGTVASTTYVQMTKPASGTIQLGSFNFLVFYLRNKAAWPKARSVTVQWYNGATPEGTPIVLSSGSYGLNTTTNTTTYQQVSIPTSVFGINNVNVTTVRFTVTGTGAALTGFYFDLATVQSGLSAPLTPNTLMNFRGAYSSAVTYAPNDVVTSGGIAYVALIQNTGVTVTTSSTWAPVATGTVVSAVIAGTANQITATGTCTITSTGTCTLSLPATVLLGTDNSVAGILGLSNGSSNAHTNWASGATTTNTIKGFATAPTTSDLVACVTSSTTCTLTDSGISDTSPTGSGAIVLANTPTLITPNIGAATGTSLLVTGIVDGTAPVTITTGTTGTPGGTYNSGYTINQEGTAATGVTYTLPTAAAGKQYCMMNGWNGSAADTGILTVATSASGQFIYNLSSGTLTATGGNMTSAGAAGDSICVVGVDATHWNAYTQFGTWTVH